MLSLHSPTPERWLAQVECRLDLLLIDHAHCEKKAAGSAMNLLFAYVEDTELCRAMTEIVQEERGLIIIASTGQSDADIERALIELFGFAKPAQLLIERG